MRTNWRRRAIEVEAKLDNALLLIHILATEKHQAVAVGRTSDGWRHTLKLYRATGAAGGYVVVTSKVGRQSPMTRFWTLDDLRWHGQEIAGMGIMDISEIDMAVESLVRVRAGLFEEGAPATSSVRSVDGGTRPTIATRANEEKRAMTKTCTKGAASRWRAWQYDPRPRGWPPVFTYSDRLAKLRKLTLACRQDEDGVYHLPGSTFTMTIAPEMERRLWG